MKKRLVSMALAMIMVCSLSITAFAAAGMSNFRASKQYIAKTFGDVPAAAWYTSSVKLCYEYGLMGGKAQGKFDPAGSMTVAEAIVMADRVYQIYNTGADTLKNGTPWYKPYVDFAVGKAIIDAGDFIDYTAPATRAQMAYIFSNALPETELKAINTVTYLPDVAAADEYSLEIYALYNAGVLTGNDKYGTFAPDSNISRNQAAAIISRVALPTERKSVQLYEDAGVDAIKFILPADYEYDASEGMDNFTYSANPEAATGAVVASASDPEFEGATIIDAMTINEAETLLNEAFASSNMKADVTGRATVKFGAVPAYRFEISVVADGVKMVENAYYFITNSAMYSVSFSSVSPSVLKTVDASLTINGSAMK